MMWIGADGVIYGGDCAQGDREATEEEIVAWKASTGAMENASQVKARLSELDVRSIRTLHEAMLALINAGAKLPDDIAQRLRAMEAQKEALRAKLT